ncbi:hypothetical protein AVEN_110356-1 [Araneus ventricosus]|uniref:Uncharacterized protein n=1 Tax=Araneus ventricosus TaxID=182803 RepID=A0A4Y2EKQ9_ARAVE|nr:hypothetical protein AVEN_110356-1 [Araneus ventricosus]
MRPANGCSEDKIWDRFCTPPPPGKSRVKKETCNRVEESEILSVESRNFHSTVQVQRKEQQGYQKSASKRDAISGTALGLIDMLANMNMFDEHAHKY